MEGKKMKDKNTPRRARALKALRSARYVDKFSLYDENIIDILTDIRHLIAKRTDLNFDDMVRISANHYRTEAN